VNPLLSLRTRSSEHAEPDNNTHVHSPLDPVVTVTGGLLNSGEDQADEYVAWAASTTGVTDTTGIVHGGHIMYAPVMCYVTGTRLPPLVEHQSTDGQRHASGGDGDGSGAQAVTAACTRMPSNGEYELDYAQLAVMPGTR
jgi:hypothetical protein